MSAGPLDIRTALSGGDRRSIGNVGRVVSAALGRPELAADLVRLLDDADPVVRMRSADALEKLQRRLPARIARFRGRLLALAEAATDQELRWHLAQMLSRLDLARADRSRFARVLRRYQSDPSAIVRVSAMQALVDLALRDEDYRREAASRVRTALSSGSPAERARARKLMPKLGGS
jgi:HEAT repeat protein